MLARAADVPVIQLEQCFLSGQRLCYLYMPAGLLGYLMQLVQMVVGLLMDGLLRQARPWRATCRFQQSTGAA